VFFFCRGSYDIHVRLYIGITMMTLAKLQEVVRPYHRVPEPSVEEELTALRHTRVDQIGNKLRVKYGL
jgi:acetoacetate decarboxylase